MGGKKMMKQYLLTERAHLMCPNMCFGIAATIDAPYDSEHIRESIIALETAHPFLRALLGYESNTNRYFYDISEYGKTTLTEASRNSNQTIQERILSDYEEIIQKDFDLREEGMLKIYTYDDGESISALFVFHHLLVDGRGGLGLVKEFVEKYVNDTDPDHVEERLIASMEDLPKNSKLPYIGNTFIKYCNKKWKKEKQMVSYPQYHEFADYYVKKDPVKHDISVVEKDELEEIIRKCKQAQVTMNDYLLAKMFIEDNTKKIIIASDIREKIHCYQPGALGNYSTAFSVICNSSVKEPIELAKIVHKKIKKMLSDNKIAMQVLTCYITMDPGLIDAAAISTLGKFESKAGEFVGVNMFGFRNQNGYSITNLGKIESPYIKSAMFIPPASPAVKKIVGVLTVNGRMCRCTSER
jgi:NRPS condensation-like uncharacterized protein